MLQTIASILLIIGGLNWGLIGFFGWNPVEMLGSLGAKIVYCAVGIAALVHIFVSGWKS